MIASTRVSGSARRALQQARPHRCPGRVEELQQRGTALAETAEQLQVGARMRVQPHRAFGRPDGDAEQLLADDDVRPIAVREHRSRRAQCQRARRSRPSPSSETAPVARRTRSSARVVSNTAAASDVSGASAVSAAGTGVPSSTSSSLGSSRASSSATTAPSMPPSTSKSSRCCVLGSNAAMPTRPCDATSATQRDTADGSSRSASTTMPGLSTRVTSRRTRRPETTSPTWSQMATRCPASSSLRMCCAIAWCGTPHIGRRPAAPKPLPVSCTPRIGAAVSASAPNISKKSPSRARTIASGCSALTARYSRRIGVSPAVSRSSVVRGASDTASTRCGARTFELVLTPRRRPAARAAATRSPRSPSPCAARRAGRRRPGATPPCSLWCAHRAWHLPRYRPTRISTLVPT